MENKTETGAQSMAKGFVESTMAERAKTQKMMEDREDAVAYAELEETEEHIKEMLERGMISDEDARRLRARAKMRVGSGTKKLNIDSRKLAGAGVISTEELLEQALKKKKKNLILDLVRKILCIEWFAHAQEVEKRRRLHPNFKHRWPFIDNMVNGGMSFELAMFVMVAANAILTGLQISVKDTPAQNDPILRILEEIFTITFVIEVILRVMADGWLWFFDLKNFLDVLLIVSTGVVPTFLGSALNMGNNPLLRCGQALRCVRLFRIVRSVRARFPIPWSLISGVLGSARILLWTLTLMGVVMYMFGIWGMQMLTRSDLHFSPELQAIVDTHFPDVIGAMFTLFQILTLDSWTGISRPLHNCYSLMGVYFVLYVCVACMVLNNLVVAVICENAFKSVDEDTELQAALQKQETEAALDTLRAIFEDMDADQSNCLSKEEYEACIATNGELVANLKAANLLEDEILDLWELMDFPATVNKEFFAIKMRSLPGNCKAKQSYKAVMTMAKFPRRMKRAKYNLQSAIRTCETLGQDARVVQQEVTMMLSQLRELVATVTRCVPSDPVPIGLKMVKAMEAEMTAKVEPFLQPILNREYHRTPLDQEAYAKVYGLQSTEPPPLQQAYGLQSTKPEPLAQLNGTNALVAARASAVAEENDRHVLVPRSDDVDLV